MEDLDKNFLVIGTPSRKRAVEKALSEGLTSAPYLGEKGIGRLSAMRFGSRKWTHGEPPSAWHGLQAGDLTTASSLVRRTVMQSGSVRESERGER